MANTATPLSRNEGKFAIQPRSSSNRPTSSGRSPISFQYSQSLIGSRTEIDGRETSRMPGFAGDGWAGTTLTSGSSSRALALAPDVDGATGDGNDTAGRR